MPERNATRLQHRLAANEHLLLKDMDGLLVLADRAQQFPAMKPVFICSAHSYSNCLVPSCVAERDESC